MELELEVAKCMIFQFLHPAIVARTHTHTHTKSESECVNSESRRRHRHRRTYKVPPSHTSPVYQSTPPHRTRPEPNEQTQQNPRRRVVGGNSVPPRRGTFRFQVSPSSSIHHHAKSTRTMLNSQFTKKSKEKNAAKQTQHNTRRPKSNEEIELKMNIN